MVRTLCGSISTSPKPSRNGPPRGVVCRLVEEIPAAIRVFGLLIPSFISQVHWIITSDGFRSGGYLACFFANRTLNIMLIAALPAKKITSAESPSLATFPTRNRM